MMFVVTNKPFSNEVEVKLAPESRKKIAKIAYWTVVAGSTASLCWDYREEIGTTINKINPLKK